MAGPTVDGWRIVSLWDSDADYERFCDESLVPALTGLGQVLTTIERSGETGREQSRNRAPGLLCEARHIAVAASEGLP
jgi:hypothetical protein